MTHNIGFQRNSSPRSFCFSTENQIGESLSASNLLDLEYFRSWQEPEQLREVIIRSSSRSFENKVFTTEEISEQCKIIFDSLQRFCPFRPLIESAEEGESGTRGRSILGTRVTLMKRSLEIALVNSAQEVFQNSSSEELPPFNPNDPSPSTRRRFFESRACSLIGHEEPSTSRSSRCLKICNFFRRFF